MRRRQKEWIKDMLNVHRSEREAWIAVIVAIVLASGWITYEQWFARPGPGDLSQEMKVLDAWLAERDNAEESPARAVELFPFDPNHLPLEQWVRLGLSEKQAQALHRYEEKGGRFRSKADLARMRVIRADLFEQWRPFIQLPDSTDHRKPDRRDAPFTDRRLDTLHASTPFAREERPAFQRLEVNSCDSAQLEALPGIGPSFARGIIKYRDQLGGYFSLDQLAEVYVLQDKPDAVVRLKELLVVDTLLAQRIAINTCTVEELAAHPYVRWKIAKPLIAYRQQHGPFASIAAIKGCALITEDVYRRLAPYLTLE